jgi:hypothetical protein
MDAPRLKSRVYRIFSFAIRDRRDGARIPGGLQHARLFLPVSLPRQ